MYQQIHSHIDLQVYGEVNKQAGARSQINQAILSKSQQGFLKKLPKENSEI